MMRKKIENIELNAWWTAATQNLAKQHFPDCSTYFPGTQASIIIILTDGRITDLLPAIGQVGFCNDS